MDGKRRCKGLALLLHLQLTTLHLSLRRRRRCLCRRHKRNWSNLGKHWYTHTHTYIHTLSNKWIRIL